jgi:hypothetical protein
MSTAPLNPISSVPGAVVPGGVTPGATPPILPGGGTPDPSTQVSEMTKRLLASLAQASQRKQFAGTPVPGAIPQRQDPRAGQNIGMNTTNPHAWGKQRFAAGVQAMISNAVADQKQKKLAKAEADWTYMSSSLDELYAAQASNDPKAVAAAQRKVDVVLGDPQKLKDMAKALNQDWLNPEKTTVYGDALKKVTAQAGQQAQTDAQKQQAAQGLRGVFQKLLGQRQQLQLTPDQQKAMSAEIQSKAPTTAGGASVKEQAEGAKAALDLEKASKEARENYAVVIAPDGKAWAYNKTNPRDAYQLKDSETGGDLRGQTKTGAAPKVAMNGSVPYAVIRGGKAVTPDSPDFTKEDRALFDGAMDASRQKQQLKIPPDIGDQIGAPPNPADYPKRDKDPAYAADLKSYGKQAMDLEMKKSSASAIARARAQNDYKIVEVTDYDADGNPVTHFTTGKAALEGGLSSATQGAKNLSRSKQIEDIEASSKNLRDAVTTLDKPFTAKQIALMQEGLKAGDESVASAEFQALANDQLTDKQFQTALWIKHLNERAMSLRNIAGMGQGAQDTRDAIRSLLPNMGTGSPERMKAMLDAFDNQVTILKSGVPKAGGQAKAEAGKAAKDAANMETQTYNGATYQRKKGSTDQWTLAPK